MTARPRRRDPQPISPGRQNDRSFNRAGPVSPTDAQGVAQFAPGGQHADAIGEAASDRPCGTRASVVLPFTSSIASRYCADRGA